VNVNAICIACMAILSHGFDDPPSPEDVARAHWYKAHAVEVATLQPGTPLDDLSRFKPMIDDARVVGLGEGTHGSHEHFRAKHRLFEFLVREKGFTVLAMEANVPEASAIDEFIKGDDRAPDAPNVESLIRGMGFWIWNTEEVRDLVVWMRSYNRNYRDAPGFQRLRFAGVDMQKGAMSLGIVRDALASHDVEWFATEGAPMVERLVSYDPMGDPAAGDFGCVTATFPVEAARGRTIRFSGSIRTEGLERGFAGLWWRVDGPTPAFDNMGGRGVFGTTDWQERSIELVVPLDAKAIAFGVLMPGTGSAWFDGLSITIDGVPWKGDGFDLDFEGDSFEQLRIAGPNGDPASPAYAVGHDIAVAHSGRQSLRIQRIPSPGLDQIHSQAVASASVLHERIRSTQPTLEPALGKDGYEWLLRNARVVEQWAGMALAEGGGFAHREQCMAENLAWIGERHPNAKIALWAHNFHVRDEVPFMGSHLRRRFGKDYVNVALCSLRGSYTATALDGRGLQEFALASPPQDAFESTLQRSLTPRLIVDLRAARADDPTSAWLTESRPFGGTIGSMEMPEPFAPVKLYGHFDLLFYVEEMRAARQLAAP
jgi:erythromycin esterase-like protein